MKVMKKITLYKNTSNNILFGIFAEFRQYFGEVSHSAKCRFGEVSFRQSGFRRSVTDPWKSQCEKECIVLVVAGQTVKWSWLFEPCWGTVLSKSKTQLLPKVLVINITQKGVALSRHDGKIVDWDVPTKQTIM